MTTAQEVEQDLVQESWNVGSPTHRELIERTKKQRCYLAAILRQTTEGTDALVESHYADDGSGFIGEFVPAEACRIYERLWKTSVAQTREECAVIAETASDYLQNSTFDGVAAAIRALSPQVERRKCERRVKQARQYFTENGNERSGNDRRKT